MRTFDNFFLREIAGETRKPQERMRLSLPPEKAAAAARRAVAHAAVVWSLVAAPSSAIAAKDTIVRVLEPNKVKLEQAGIVTLAGSYTPKRLPGCFAYDPAAALRRALPPKTAVDVTVLPGKASNAKVAWIYRSKDNLLVQSSLVEGGWAQANARTDADDPRIATLQAKQAEAKAKQIGLWQDCDEAAAAEAARADRIDLDTQFEPLAGSEFEYGRVAPAAVSVATVVTAQSLPDPGDSKNCSDFDYFEDAKQFFDRYYPLYGDVAKLDGDNDGVPCQGLPHTPRRELYQAKSPRAEFRLRSGAG